MKLTVQTGFHQIKSRCGKVVAQQRIMTTKQPTPTFSSGRNYKSFWDLHLLPYRYCNLIAMSNNHINGTIGDSSFQALQALSDLTKRFWLPLNAALVLQMVLVTSWQPFSSRVSSNKTWDQVASTSQQSSNRVEGKTGWPATELCAAQRLLPRWGPSLESESVSLELWDPRCLPAGWWYFRVFQDIPSYENSKKLQVTRAYRVCSFSILHRDSSVFSRTYHPSALSVLATDVPLTRLNPPWTPLHPKSGSPNWNESPPTCDVTLQGRTTPDQFLLGQSLEVGTTTSPWSPRLLKPLRVAVEHLEHLVAILVYTSDSQALPNLLDWWWFVPTGWLINALTDVESHRATAGHGRTSRL